VKDDPGENTWRKQEHTRLLGTHDLMHLHAALLDRADWTGIRGAFSSKVCPAGGGAATAFEAGQD